MAAERPPRLGFARLEPKILVTDSLFIFDEHIEQLGRAGYEIERLDKPEANEAELCEVVKGKVGYILGGIEQVTDKVIESADELQVIAFTGADWARFIPGHALATKRGIAIANAPGANSAAVAEYTITLLLMMLRRVLELGNTGHKAFLTTSSLSEVQIGIVGLGRIGQKVAKLLKGLGAQNVVYWSRERKENLEQELGIKYVSLEELMAASDVISNHVSSEAGTLLGAEMLSSIKQDVLIINTGADNTFDYDALYQLLEQGKARAALDDKITHSGLASLDPATYFHSNEHTGYNTHAANKLGSDMATASILNLLATGADQNLVNPEFKAQK